MTVMTILFASLLTSQALALFVPMSALLGDEPMPAFFGSSNFGKSSEWEPCSEDVLERGEYEAICKSYLDRLDDECYEKCPRGYKRAFFSDEVCQQTCPGGFEDMGDSCRPKSEGPVVDCLAKGFGEAKPDGSCRKNVVFLDPPTSLECPSYLEAHPSVDGLCVVKCPTGYDSERDVCRKRADCEELVTNSPALEKPAPISSGATNAPALEKPAPISSAEVKIVIDRDGKILNFAEVKAFDSNGELLKPLGAELNRTRKPAHQCIDGNLNTRCETKKSPNPKLTISYPEGSNIVKIVVENRRGCCQQRADGARIAVFQGDSKTWSSTLEGAQKTYVFDVSGEHETGNTLVTDPPVTENPVDPPTTELTPPTPAECSFTNSVHCFRANGCRWVGSTPTTGQCMVDGGDEQCDVDDIGPKVQQHILTSGNIVVADRCMAAGQWFRSEAAPDGTLDLLKNPQIVGGLLEAACPCLVELEDAFVREIFNCKMGPVAAVALYEACAGMA